MIGVLGRSRVLDRFFRLRHDAVVSGDHEHDDVGRLCAARAHRGECCMAGRIEERDLPLRNLDVIRTDVLRDAAGFAARDARFADVVEQRRLAVVDVTHDRDDRRTRLRVAFDVQRLFVRVFERIGRDRLRDVSHLFDHEDRAVLIEHVVDRRHHAHAHQRLDDFAGFDRHALREIADGDRFRHLHFALHDFRRTFEFAALLVDLALRPAQIRLQRDFAAATLLAVAEFVVELRFCAPRLVLVAAAIFRSALR